MPKKVKISKAEIRAKAVRFPRDLTPRNRMLLDEYFSGELTASELERKHSIKTKGYFKRLLYRPQAKEYEREWYKRQRARKEESYKLMTEAIRRIVERQIVDGKIETRTTYNKKGEMISKTVIESPWTIRDLVEVAKVSGDYNPSLTVNQTDSKTKEEDYIEVLEHIKTLKQKGA